MNRSLVNESVPIEHTATSRHAQAGHTNSGHTKSGDRATGNVALYQRVQSSPEFAGLLRRRRRFVIPVSIGFTSWYASYLLLAAYAPGLMAVRVLGNITFALAVGALQVMSIFLVAGWYVRHADRTIEPGSRRVRDLVEELDAFRIYHETFDGHEKRLDHE